MRSKFLVMAVAAAAALVSATAFAQGDQPPAPAPEPLPAPAAPGISGTLGSDGATVAPMTAAPGQDTAQNKTEPAKTEEKKESPWQGTTFLWSQYTSTQTVGLGADTQSNNPLYAWWMYIRPRYHFIKDDWNALNATLRFDWTLEWTNSDGTTKKQEIEWGNVWLLGGYTRTLYKDDKGWATKVGTGPRVLIPTSKQAWNAGTRLMPGWTVSASQAVPIAGKGKEWFSGVTLSGSVSYTKFINTSTTAYNPDFKREVTDTGGRVFVSSQYSGGALTNHQVLAYAGLDLSIHERLSLSVLQFWIMAWKYQLPENQQIQTQTGPTNVGSVQDPQRFTNLTWFYPSLDFDLLPEVSVGLGYYNLANQIAPNGQRRSPFWSPDAVVLFDVVANLDAIYETVTTKKDKDASKAAIHQAKRQARQSVVGNNPMLTW